MIRVPEISPPLILKLLLSNALITISKTLRKLAITGTGYNSCTELDLNRASCYIGHNVRRGGTNPGGDAAKQAVRPSRAATSVHNRPVNFATREARALLLFTIARQLVATVATSLEKVR